MGLALFVPDSQGIAVVTGKTARAEVAVGAFFRIAKDNERGWRLLRIGAQPRGVGEAYGGRQMVGGPEYLDRALLTVIADQDTEAGPLLGWQGIANAGD